jgi:hypothetical protein
MAVCSGEQKDEPAWSGPIEMCEIRAARIIYELAPSRALCAAIRRTLLPQIRALSASGARSGVQKVCCNNEQFSPDGRQTPDYRPTCSCSHDCVPLRTEGLLYVGRTLCAPIGASVKENSSKGVDDLSLALHNLVSLLQMQRRRTKRCRVVVVRQRGVKRTDL